MKVIYNGFNNEMTFGDIQVGECFLYERELYIKCANCFNELQDVPLNAVCLDDGLFARFSENEIVLPAAAKVVFDTV